MSDPRISKLPKWAQEHIYKLEHRLEQVAASYDRHLRTREEGNYTPGFYARPPSGDNTLIPILPLHSTLVVDLGVNRKLQLQRTDPDHTPDSKMALHISSQNTGFDGLKVLPVVSNSLLVSIQDRS